MSGKKLGRWRTLPCPDRSCGGFLSTPVPPRREPVSCTCDGVFKHTFDVSLLVPSKQKPLARKG